MEGTLATDFITAANMVFRPDNPEAAMYYEGGFIGGIVAGLRWVLFPAGEGILPSTIGASGAVMAVTILFAFYFPAFAGSDDQPLLGLHGHVHEKWRQRGRMINVGVDAWGGYPVTDTHLATLITAGENDLRPLPWNIHSQ